MGKGFLKLFFLRPRERISTHIHKYTDLFREGLQAALLSWRLRLWLYGLSAVFFMVGVFCSGVALLLWGALPVLSFEHAWVLVALPALLLGISAVFYVTAKRIKIPLFGAVQEQFKLDLARIFPGPTKESSPREP